MYIQNMKTIFEIGEVEYQWNDDDYIRPEVKDLIIYEMHIGDFIGIEGEIGTYETIIEKINSGYFAELGINAIEIMAWQLMELKAPDVKIQKQNE